MNASSLHVERILAPNPGPFTGRGTNTYVIASSGSSLILDPGPLIDSHLEAIARAVSSTSPVAVLVTHTHPDHAPAANSIAAEFGVPALGSASGPAFEPTDILTEGQRVPFGDHSLEVVFTPGHTPDHVCYATGGILFTGDHIISGSTVILEDAGAYMASLHKVATLRPELLYPGHGEMIVDAQTSIAAYIAHREARERQLLDAVRSGPQTIDDLVGAVYADVPQELAAAARTQVEVQLRKLAAEGRVRFGAGTAERRTILLGQEATE